MKLRDGTGIHDNEGTKSMSDEKVNHPKHYNANPSGVECIAVVEHMNFNIGNAIKYLWRAGMKEPDVITDLKKAKWYIEREIVRVTIMKKNEGSATWYTK